MPVEETLKKLLETVAREVEEARADLSRAVESERADAAAAARDTAEADLAKAIAQAEATAEARGRAAGHAEGMEAGREAGKEAGHKEGYDAGFAAGREEGLAEGREEGKKEGKEEGRKEGRQEGREEGREEGKQEGLREGRDAGREEGRQAAAEAIATSERIAAAIRAIDGARSLSEILNALATSAAREAARVAVLLVRGHQLHGWRIVGFEGVDDRLELPLDQGGLVAEAVRTAGSVSGEAGAPATPSFAQLPHGRQILAVPIQLSGQVIGVVYADPGGGEFDTNPTWPASVELLTRYAARCIEATTAFRAAKVLTEPQRSSSAAPASAADTIDRVDDAQAAQRYARLLVSEIRLYHEEEVIAGRRERDLASRLGGEIARARVLYEQRVPAHVRRSGDHFNAELVRTLADGDASLLNLET